MQRPPNEPPADVPSLFGRERDDLLALLGTLADADWERPTPCPGWTVLDVCRHLLGGDLSLLSARRDGHRGTPSPAGLTEAQFIDWLDDLQVEWVHAARRLSPRLVHELLGWSGPRLADELRREDPRSRTASVSWTGPHPVPVWLDQVRELSEQWIHRQQLLQAVARPTDLRPSPLATILDGLRWAYPHRLDAVPARDGATVVIEVAGPVAVTWHLVATGGHWGFRPEPGPDVVAGGRLTTEQAWRLLSNNLPPADLDGLDLWGDARLVDVIRRTRAIIGTPNV
jgi:uncharacterized protein (TIGR03083 family)